MSPVKHVGVVGFEPAIQGALESLLSAEPDLAVVRFPRNWAPGAPEEPVPGSPDVLIIAPQNSDWVNRLHTHFPQARLLAMVEWHRREQFRSTPIRGYFERFQSYPGLIELLRATD